VVRSSDGSSVANSDLWTDYSKVNWSNTNGADGPRSWCVLRQTGISANFEMCIGELKHGYYQYDWGQSWNFYIAPGGYDLTTGTTTWHPSTLAGGPQFTFQDFSNWAGGSVDWNYLLHHQQSNDGKCTRTLIMANGVPFWFFICDVPKDVYADGTQWPYGKAVFRQEEQSASPWPPTYSRLYRNALLYSHMVLGGSGTSTTFYMGGEHIGAASLGESWGVPNDCTGKYSINPIPIFSGTSGARGRQGCMVDLYWANAGLPTGTTYPADGSRLWAQFGNLILPWNGEQVYLG
jgi:hypothetical protein